MPHRRRLLAVAVLCLLPVTAVAWEPPAHWAELGTVEEWLELDSLIWRFESHQAFVDNSQKGVDLEKAYAGTREYLGSVDAVDLAAFLALDADDRRDRIDEADRHRSYVGRFRNRMVTFVNRAQSEQPIGWGEGVADVMVVGECLKHLRAAVGLDPANPYAWRLYAMFAGIVGDTGRALVALDGAEAALTRVPAGELPELRAGVALDRAWLLRERGDLTGALTAVEDAAAHGAPDLDVTLLRGLLAAQSGDIQTAVELAARLRKVEITHFMLPVSMGNHSWINSGFWHPDRTNVRAWKKKPSDYLRSWILALAWLREGQPDMAAKAFRRYSVKDIYPFGWRFWREAGRIYEVTGRPVLASKAWAAGRVWIPYAPFFPSVSHTADVSRLTGRGGNHAVFLGFGRFYVSGHRLVQGLLDAADALAVEDELEKLAAAGRAVDALESCRDAGHYPGPASLVLGAVYNHVGDIQSAVLEVEAAMEAVAAAGDAYGQAALLTELANLRADFTVTRVQEFYGQSGAVDGRWSPVADPEAELSALRAAFDAEASDASRRDLARHLIRQGDLEGGHALVSDHADGSAADMVLLLEAERALGRSDRASELVAELAAGQDRYGDAQLWTLAGFVCLDDGRVEDARVALERALELDPGNRALRWQMRLLP